MFLSHLKGKIQVVNVIALCCIERKTNNLGTQLTILRRLAHILMHYCSFLLTMKLHEQVLHCTHLSSMPNVYMQLL